MATILLLLASFGRPSYSEANGRLFEVGSGLKKTLGGRGWREEEGVGRVGEGGGRGGGAINCY